jgi:hypothetical protein
VLFIPSSVTSIYSSAIPTTTAIIGTEGSSANNYAKNHGNLFVPYDGVNMPELFIEDGITYIAVAGEAYAIAADKSLTEVVIPAEINGNKVVSIDAAFKDNNNLKSITLPEGLESIGKEAFSGCEAIKAMKTPSTLKSIDNLAFYKCPGLNADGALELTASIEKIGEFAFTGIDKNLISAPADSFAAEYVAEMKEPVTAETEAK